MDGRAQGDVIVTTPTPTFWLMHVDSHAPLDPNRVYLFNLWFHFGLHDRLLVLNQEWFQLAAAIVSGAPLDGRLGLELPGAPSQFEAELDGLINDERKHRYHPRRDDRPFVWIFDDPSFEKFVDGQFE